MHNAPSVVYPLGRSRFQGWVLAALWAAGLGVTVLWAVAAPRLDWRLGVALLALVAVATAAWLGWRNAPSGQVRWDGQDWLWESPGYRAGTPVLALSVVLDLQRVLLLKLENQDHATLWLWAHRVAMPERWLDLRRAVYSRRKASPAAAPSDWSGSTSLDAADFPVETDPPRLYP